MVLYHLSTTYQLLYCIVHRLARHPQEEAGLLMVEYIRPENQRKEFVKKLEESGWFSFVRLVPENNFKLRRGASLQESSSSQEIEGVIHNVCACVKGWLNLDLSRFSRIYIGSDQWSFGIYCLANRIPHVYIEDASGMLSQRERYMKITREISMTNYVISQYLHGAGTSEYETARLCDMRNFQNGFTDEKAENFSIYDALTQEIPEKVPELLAFYGAQPVVVKEGEPVCVFMTQYLKSMAVKDLDVQEQITTMLVDYFAEGFQLVVKPHPKDIWLNYRRILPEAVLLPHTMNSELLPFVFSRPADRVLTASSTSIGGLAPFAREVFQFTTEIESAHERLHGVYIAAVILQGLAQRQGRGLSLSCDEVNQVQLESFLQMLRVPCEDGGYPVRVSGREEDLWEQEGTVVFLPKEKTSLPRGRFSRLLEVRGSLCPEEGSLFAPREYTVYVSAPDGEESPLAPVAFVKELPHSHAKLYVQSRLLTGADENKGDDLL